VSLQNTSHDEICEPAPSERLVEELFGNSHPRKSTHDDYVSNVITNGRSCCWHEEARRLMSEHRFLKSCAGGYIHRAHQHGLRWTAQENKRDCIARTKHAAQDERNYTLRDWKNIAARARPGAPPLADLFAAPAGLNHIAKNLLRSTIRKQRDYATARRRRDGAGDLELKQHADRIVRAHRVEHGMDGDTWEHPEYREPIYGADDDGRAHDAIEEVEGEDQGPPGAEVEDGVEAEDAHLVAYRNALRLAILGLDGGIVDPDWDVSLWSQLDVLAAKHALDKRAVIEAAGLEVLPDDTALPRRNSPSHQGVEGGQEGQL
jgi:hypothetical protein